MKDKLKEIKSKDMINKVKAMKKNGTTFEEVMFYVFLEMVKRKSPQIVMDMKNDEGESIQMVVAIGNSGDIKTEEVEEIEEDFSAFSSMVS